MALRFVALFRGINVGGKNKLAMKPLAAMFAEAGCLEVTTYIQSGNVLFDATADLAATIPGRLSARIYEELGFRTPITLRSADQLTGVILDNPLVGLGVSQDSMHVMFLNDLPTQARVASLDPARSHPDTFIVQGREVYLNLPDGLARSKLTNAYFDSKLGSTSTIRNWRTVLKLGAMMGGQL